MDNLIVCLGTRGSRELVRCISSPSGKIFIPPYEPTFKWRPISTSAVEIVYTKNNVVLGKVIIPMNKTKITAFQCLGSGSEVGLSNSQFYDLLKYLSV